MSRAKIEGIGRQERKQLTNRAGYRMECIRKMHKIRNAAGERNRDGQPGRAVRRLCLAALFIPAVLAVVSSGRFAGWTGMGAVVEAAGMEDVWEHDMAGVPDVLAYQGWAGLQDFTGQEYERVKAEMERYGCRVAARYCYDSQVPEGHIISQTSQDVTKIEEITFAVSLGEGENTGIMDYGLLTGEASEGQEDMPAGYMEFFRFCGGDGMEFAYPEGVYSRCRAVKDGEDWSITLYGSGRLQYRAFSRPEAYEELTDEASMEQYLQKRMASFGEVTYSYTGARRDYQIGIVTGYYGSSRKNETYLLCSMKDDKIYEMIITYPTPENEEQEAYAGYLTDCLYRSCSFSGVQGGRRSFEDYCEDPAR